MIFKIEEINIQPKKFGDVCIGDAYTWGCNKHWYLKVSDTHGIHLGGLGEPARFECVNHSGLIYNVKLAPITVTIHNSGTK